MYISIPSCSVQTMPNIREVCMPGSSTIIGFQIQYTVKEGSLSCLVRGSPDLIIVWEKDTRAQSCTDTL